MPQRILDITLPIDPRLLQVNRRIKGGHWIKPEVREAMQQMFDGTIAYLEKYPVELNKDVRFRADLSYWFPNRQSDLDGPIKRTLDSCFRALRSSTERPEANDARIDILCVFKFVGPPRVSVVVETLDNAPIP